MRVDANYRFIAAYQEVNTRVAQRQQALALYVSLVVSLLAALVALRPGSGAGTLPAEWLALGFPVATLNLALLNYKSERAITNLRRFLALPTLVSASSLTQDAPAIARRLAELYPVNAPLSYITT